jgi:hypothetical protein
MDIAQSITRDRNLQNIEYLNSVSKKAKAFDGYTSVHELAISAVRFGAKQYLEKASKASDHQSKAAYIEAHNLLINFASGNGDFESVYFDTHPFAKELNQDNKLLKSVKSDLEAVVSAGGYKDVVDFLQQRHFFSGGYEFSPDHKYEEKGVAGVIESIQMHIDAIKKNPIEFVIGGMSYTVMPVYGKKKDIKSLVIEFSNVSGKESLILHKATNVDHIEGKSIPLSDKKQKFIFTISISDYKKISNETSKSN